MEEFINCTDNSELEQVHGIMLCFFFLVYTLKKQESRTH